VALQERDRDAPSLLLAEVGGALARRTGQAGLAEQIVADLLADPTVELVPLDQGLAVRAARDAIAFGLRGADATYVAVARAFNVPLVTWDREQAARTAGAIRTHTPATAPTVPPAPVEDPNGQD
jgi:predicted nucleic acid-binding protein